MNFYPCARDSVLEVARIRVADHPGAAGVTGKPARLLSQKLAFVAGLIDHGSMSDMNKRGPECDDDGERGRRGKRGHDGHDGSTGPTGPTGPTGSTGPTGPGSGDPVYGYAVADANQTIPPNTDVTFNLGGIPPNVGLTPPAPGGTAFVVLTAGDYEYNFYVAGFDAPFGTMNPLVFTIFLNGVSAGVPHTFRSNQQASAADSKVCRGQGILSIAAGTSVTLRNTNEDTVTLTAMTFGDGESAVIPTANATLSLKKLSKS